MWFYLGTPVIIVINGLMDDEYFIKKDFLCLPPSQHNLLTVTGHLNSLHLKTNVQCKLVCSSLYLVRCLKCLYEFLITQKIKCHKF